MTHVYDHIDEFAKALKDQLIEDEKRWGDTYLHRTRKGQAARFVQEVANYFDKFSHGGQPFPWLKVSGNAYIHWLRETHPDLSDEWQEEDE